MGKGTAWVGIFVVMILALAVYGFASGEFDGLSMGKIMPKEDLTQSEFCVNNPLVNLEYRNKDMESTTTLYLTGDVYYQDLDSKSISTATIDNPRGYDSHSDVLECGKTYKVWWKQAGSGYTDNTTISDAVVITAKNEKNYVEMEGHQISYPKFRVYDLEDEGWVSDASGYSGASYKTYASNPALHYDSTTNVTAKTIGANDVLHYRIEVASNTSDYRFGDDVIMLLDIEDSSNVNDWDESETIIKWNGASLDVKDVTGGGLNADEQVKWSAYEQYVLIPGGFDDATTQEIELYLKASEDGSDTCDDDPIIQFAMRTGDGAGYLSDDDPNAIVTSSAVRDDTSQTMMSGVVQQITFDVA
jgi:hypothetical protein